MAILEGSFVRKKLGPLPVWAWMGLGLGAALVVSTWQRNKQAASTGEEVASGQTSDAYGVSQMYQLPETLQPTYAFVDADTTLVTLPTHPPGGGRPPTAPAGGPTTTPATPSTPVVAGPLTRKAPGTAPTSIKVLGTGNQKLSWSQILPMFYNNVPTDPVKRGKAASALRAANAGRPAGVKGSGSGKWETVLPGDAVTVPATIVV